VRAALATDDVQRMRDARDALQQAMFRISEQIYSQAGGADATSGGEPGGENPSSGPSDDNTVEGEFKEA
jgi:molecular chaperone DnaK